PRRDPPRGGRPDRHLRPLHRRRLPLRALRTDRAVAAQRKARGLPRHAARRHHLRHRLDAGRRADPGSGPLPPPPRRGAAPGRGAAAGAVGRGVGLLIAYSAGLGLPFLLSAVALGSFLKFFKRYRPFIPTVERAAGALLVVVGVLVITNKYVLLNAWAISLTPDWLLKRL